MSELKPIRVADIVLPKEVLRKEIDDDALQELAESIQTLGLLQPILVRHKGKKWELIAGFRRLLAHKRLQRTEILANCKPATYDVSEAAALVENVQRADLGLFDEAQAVRQLVDTHGWGVPETARQLSKGQNWVRDRLDVLRLPEELADAVQKDTLSMGAALELAKIPDDHIRREYTHFAVTAGINLAQAKQWRHQAIIDAQQAAAGADDPEAQQRPLAPPVFTLYCFACEQHVEASLCRTVHLCHECLAVTEAEKDMSYGRANERHEGPDENHPVGTRPEGSGVGDHRD